MKPITIQEYSTLSLIIAILLLISVPMSAIFSLFGSIPFVLLIATTGWVYGHIFAKQLHATWIFGMFFSVSCFPIGITPLYWMFGYMTWYPVATALLMLVVTTLFVYITDIPRLEWTPVARLRKISLNEQWRLIIPLFLLLLIAFVLSQKMTGDTIFSPWQQFGLKFWLVSGGTLIALLYTLRQTLSFGYSYLLLVLWYGVVYSLTLFTHKYAFGFDQHIHLASMEWIRTHGTIEPKVPYYLGQYFTALPLTELTGLSLDWISRALVPITAALLLPLVLLQQSIISKRAIVLLPLLPLGFLTFTTPNNFALLISLTTVLWLWTQHATEGRSKHIVTVHLTFWAIITHALIGVPLVAAILLWYSRTWWQRTVSFVFLLAGVPLLLALYGGGTTLVFEPRVFLQLFAQPHWYIGTGGSVLLQALYAYKVYLLAPVMAAITLLGAWQHRREPRVGTLLLTTLGVVGAAFLIATMVRFPALIAYEQISYAGRILALALATILPIFLLGLQSFSRRTLAIVILIPLLLISWYFTYPTRDKISYYTSVSIRDADIEAIEFVEADADGTPYIVLTNQTVSAAALSIYGFERYRTVPSGSAEYLYAIPTGGPLYSYFREYIYEGYNRSSIEAAMEFAGVDRAYLIHTNYWAPAAEIRDVSRKVADEWWEFDGARVWVYRFDR